MKSRTILITFIILIACLFVLQKIVTTTYNKQPSILDTFADCLKTTGAKFYGHYQCSHCKSQKALFGTASDSLPYVECGILGKSLGDGQAKACENLDIPGLPRIEGYPTWVFADKTFVTGEQSVASLAEKTSCPIPEGYKAEDKNPAAITATPTIKATEEESDPKIEPLATPSSVPESLSKTPTKTAAPEKKQ